MEVWIKGYGGRYSVTDAGVIFTHKNRTKTRLSGYDMPNGYRMVSLSMYGVKKSTLVHREVAKAFIPNTYNKPEVNHKDGNKSNNSAINLEWVTSVENMQHAMNNNLLVGRTMIPIEQVREIRRLYMTGKHNSIELGDMFNIAAPYVMNLVTNKRRKDSVYSTANVSNIARNNLLNACAKVSIEQIREIKKLYAGGGYTYQTLADKYGVHKSRIGALLAKKTWGWQEI